MDGRNEIDARLSEHTEEANCNAGDHATIPMSANLRLLKTFCMWLVYVGLGCSVGVAYATVEDMVEAYRASYDDVTTAQMVKAVGLMTGFIFGTPITDRFRKQADFFLFLFGLLFGAAVCAIPWSPNLICVGFFFYFSGLCHSTLDICCVTISITLWGKKASAVVVGLYTCLAIGQTVSPLITAPFLSKPMVHNNSNETFDSRLNSFTPMFHEYCEVYSEKENMTSTQMEIPYAVFGGWSILIALTFLAFYLLTPGYNRNVNYERKPIQQMINPGNCTNGNTWFGVYFVMSLFVAYFFLNGRDRGFGMFVFTVANKGIGVTKSTSALILFSYNAVGTLARGFCAFISIYIQIQIIVMTLVVGAVIVQIIVVFFALHSEAYFWLLICLMSVFITPIYPFLMPWADRYIKMNGVVMGFVNLGTGCGGISCMFLSSYVYQHYSSQAVVVLALVYGIGLALVFVPLQIISHNRGTRRLQTDLTYTDASTEQLISNEEQISQHNINHANNSFIN